jgi:hypothetical protein
MHKWQIALAALAVALVAALTLYGSLERPPLPPLSPEGNSAPAPDSAARPRPSAPSLGGSSAQPPADSPRTPPAQGDPPAGQRSQPPGPPAAPDSPAAAARRLLELLPQDDCAAIVRFADGESDRYRSDARTRALVEAFESAQQYCYQRERLPELARERREEAERLATRFLETPASPARR